MRTITARAEIDLLFTRGSRVAQNALLVLAIRTPEARGPAGRVLFVAGKKLGSGVVRNRSKRVMRAAVSRVGGPWPGWDIALVARPTTRLISPDALDAALRAAIDRLQAAP
jgi:ribonuclease P protein component